MKGGTADHIVATPGVLFVAQGDSSAVLLSVVDQQGTSLDDPISITSSGSAIRVAPDSAFRPIFNSGDSLVFNTNGTELRVWVVANDKASTSFTVAGGGLTMDVPVTVIPASSDAFAFSNLAPVLGEIVTVTTPADLVFTDSTKVLFGATSVTPSSVATDGSSLTFNVQPGLVGPASFSNVTLSYNSDVVFTVQAADTLNSPPVVEDFTFSNLTPAIGEAITITPPAGVVFTSATKVTFDSLGPEPHYTIAGDGSSMTLTAGPNSVGPTTFTKMTDVTNQLITFTLQSSDTLQSAGVDLFLTTVDITNALANQPITFTGATANFKFDIFNSAFTVGGQPALLAGVSADSTQATVLPLPGTTAGSTDLDGPVVAGFLLSSLPTDAPPITVAALAAVQAGTDAFATAPTINAPGVGEAIAFWDGGPYSHASPFGDGDRLYKLVVPADGSFRFSMPYISDGSDLGIYFYDDTGAPLSSGSNGLFVDDNGSSPNAESGDLDLTAGTYYMAVVWFDYTTAASLYGLSITGLEP